MDKARLRENLIRIAKEKVRGAVIAKLTAEEIEAYKTRYQAKNQGRTPSEDEINLLMDHLVSEGRVPDFADQIIIALVDELLTDVKLSYSGWISRIVPFVSPFACYALFMYSAVCFYSIFMTEPAPEELVSEAYSIHNMVIAIVALLVLAIGFIKDVIIRD